MKKLLLDTAAIVVAFLCGVGSLIALLMILLSLAPHVLR